MYHAIVYTAIKLTKRGICIDNNSHQIVRMHVQASFLLEYSVDSTMTMSESQDNINGWLIRTLMTCNDVKVYEHACVAELLFPPFGFYNGAI